MSEQSTQFLWHASVDGSDIKVEIARGFLRDTSRLMVDGRTVVQDAGLRLRDLATSVPTGNGQIPVAVSFTGSSFALNDATRLCTLTWNGRQVPLEVLRAPWLSTKPAWLRLVIILALFAIVIAIESALPPLGAEGIRLVIPVLLLLILLNIPYSRPSA